MPAVAARRRHQTAGALALAPAPSDNAEALEDYDGLPGWVRQLSVSYQLCRGTSHDWDGLGRFHRAGPAFFVELATCRTCSTRRARVYNRHGQIVDGGYAYPDGYQKPAGEEYDTVSRAEVRGLLFRQAPPPPLTTMLRQEVAELFPRLGELV